MLERDEGWKRLKEFQRRERQAFFAEGKSAFSELRRSIYREVRGEFRERWSKLYAAQREGADVATLKAELVADQKATLDSRRDEACQELRRARDAEYRELLDDQRQTRLGFRWREEAGLDNGIYFEMLADRKVAHGLSGAFSEAASRVTLPKGVHLSDEASTETDRGAPRDNSRMRSGADIAGNIGMGIGFTLISLLDGLVGGGAENNCLPRSVTPSTPEEANPFEAIINDMRKRQEQEREEVAESWRRRQRLNAGE